MPTLVAVILVSVAIVLLVVGLAVGAGWLALLGLVGGVVVGAVRALAVGGDWIREASRGRFRDDR